MRSVVSKVTVICVVVAAGAAGAAGAAPARQALPVSPGSAGAIPEIEGRCPTFTWAGVDGADEYEIVVYPVDAETRHADTGTGDFHPHLRVVVPGGATAWTPSAARCLAPGQSYGWSVRAVGKGGGPWSDAFLFRVSSQPAAAEVAEALEILRRYAASDGKAERERAEAVDYLSGVKRLAPRSSQALAPSVAEPLSIASAALRADADVTGHGVVGVTGDPASAGIVAVNSAPGGADLILAGDGVDSPDAALSESGILFASTSPVVFDFTSTSGETTLSIDSVPVVTTATDKDALGALAPCSSGEIPKWTGASWECAGDADTLAGLTCASEEIAKWNGSVWTCAADTDTNTDTLAGLSCGSGQVAKWSGGDWQCASDIGASPILASASVETPIAAEGTILSLAVTAPPGGCTLVVNAIGGILFQATQPDQRFDDPICALYLDDPDGTGTPLPGSRHQVSVDLFLRYDQCVSTATVALTEGSHTIDYRLTVNTDPGGNSDPATPGPTSMWAICLS